MDFILINLFLLLVAIGAAGMGVVIIMANAFGTTSGGSPDERPALIAGAVSIFAAAWLFWRLWGPWGLIGGAIVLWAAGATLALRFSSSRPFWRRALVAALWPLLIFSDTRPWLLKLGRID